MIKNTQPSETTQTLRFMNLLQGVAPPNTPANTPNIEEKKCQL